MKALILASLLLSTGGWAMAPVEGRTLTGDPYVLGHQAAAGRLMVRLAQPAFDRQANGSAVLSAGELASFANRRGVTSIETLIETELLDAANLEAGHDRDLVVHFDASTDLEAELAVWNARPEVDYAEPDWTVYTMLTTPNDQYYTQQWALRNVGQYPAYGNNDVDIDADEAWDIFTGSTDVTIAVIDTGVDLNHPDLQAKIVPGYDYVNNDATADDDNMHGTACASLAAAMTNNSTGMSGVDWNARIMPMKALAANGSGYTTDIIDCVNWARQNGADVISMSLGGGGYSSTFNSAITTAYNAGVAVIAAAGNDNASSISYPAAYSNCMAVGALSPCNERKSPSSCDGEYWWGSNYGTGLDVMAPGVDLRSATINSYILNMNGTSGATPHVAGVAALIKGADPTLTAGEIYTIIRDSAVDMGTIGYDTTTGYGRLNAYAALLLVSPPDPCEVDADGPAIVHSTLPATDDTVNPYPVEAVITDDCGVLDAYVRWNTGGSWVNVSMSNTSGDTWAGSIPAQAANTTVYYEIIATDDSANNNQSTVAGSFFVQDPCQVDFQAPLVVHTPLTDTLDEIGPYDALFEVTDDCGIAVINCNYRVDGGSWNPVSTVFIGSDTYASQIPGLAGGGLIEYSLVVVDGSPIGNFFNQTWAFSVTASTPPPSPAVSATVNSSVSIQLEWDAVTNANGYHVYESVDGGSSWNLLQSTTDTTLLVTVADDQVRLYRVTSHND
jgi:subtilisin family serine protease